MESVHTNLPCLLLSADRTVMHSAHKKKKIIKCTEYKQPQITDVNVTGLFRSGVCIWV